jgi:hypothetical protein
MVDDVRGSESQDLFAMAIRNDFMAFPVGYFAVLDHTGLAIFQNDKANGFLGGPFPHDFGGNIESFGEGIANKGGIGDADKAVVDAVRVDVLNLAAFEIRKNRVGDEREI